MEHSPVRVGFIGCGRVAENHRAALARCPQARLVAASGRNPERVRARTAEWGVQVTQTPEEMVLSEAIDAVFVLTPTESHFQYAQMAICNGKHVLVEKPVSYELQQIEELDKLARRHGVQCMPGHSYLYLPELSRMARFARERRAGEPFYLFMSEIYRMPEEYLARYHGPLKEVLCHEIYIVLALLGTPRKVQAFSACFREQLRSSEEQVAVNLQFADGALAHLFLSWAGEDETSDPWTFKVKLLGLNGGFHFSRKDAVTDILDRRPPWEYPLYDEMFHHQAEYFINECILQGRQPLSTLNEARTALLVTQAVERSINLSTIVDMTEGQAR